MKKIKRAIISVYDKTGLDELADFLIKQDIIIISTGGTAKYLRHAGFTIVDLASITKFPEILDGRVKTLHPHIHAAILYDRDKNEHAQTLAKLDIAPIDLVVVNFYRKDHSIDIGGPAMIRAAAKNYTHVCALADHSIYKSFIAHYKEFNSTTLEFRRSCAAQAFSITANYDLDLANNFNLPNLVKLKYGENPHQQAHIITKNLDSNYINLAANIPLSHNKNLSYNNMLDAQAGINSLRSLLQVQTHSSSAAVIIKHGVPCGAALEQELSQAIKQAINSDEQSAFGGILVCNNILDLNSYEIIKNNFFELIIAPNFTAEALALLANKKNLRLLAINNIISGQIFNKNIRSIHGGLLEQDNDPGLDINKLICVTKRQPSKQELDAMITAFALVITTPSNAITIATANKLLGVGAGQPKRIQACELAVNGAMSRGFTLKTAALASDAFFNFTDSLDYAHAHGLELIIQPGGSIKDQELIKHADELNMCMLFTKTRHFKH